MACNCNCGCQFRESERSIFQSQSRSAYMGPLLAKKPSVENGKTTDQYDEGDFELVDELKVLHGPDSP
jgi:hypothetical protein